MKLAESGIVWDGIYNIQNKQPWMAAQKKLGEDLRVLDKLREKARLGGKERSPLGIMQEATNYQRKLLANFSWKSCAIEKNPLSLATARRVKSAMPKVAFMTDHVFKEAIKLCLPTAQELIRLDSGDVSMSERYLELRNNIVATQAALSCRYLERASKPEERIEDLRAISRILFLGMKVHFKAGELRTVPIQVHSDPTAIFPYPMELPQNLVRWSEFVGEDPQVHPLLKAAWDSLYYVSIHPFSDGNGRISRILFTAHVAKNGMVPVICSKGLKREAYLRNIRLSVSGNPLPWCEDLVHSQIAALKGHINATSADVCVSHRMFL